MASSPAALVNVTGVTLRKLDIASSGEVGIHLEAGSKDNVVTHKRIRGHADTVFERNESHSDSVETGVPAQLVPGE